MNDREGTPPSMFAFKMLATPQDVSKDGCGGRGGEVEGGIPLVIAINNKVERLGRIPDVAFNFSSHL